MTSSPPLDATYLRSRLNLGHRYPDSPLLLDGAVLWMEEMGGHKGLAILSPPGHPLLDRFAGIGHGGPDGHVLTFCPADGANAAVLREAVPGLRPVPLGLSMSAGFGDRLGVATPGHVAALRHVSDEGHGSSIAPIFAQQSIREMVRTGRTPADVLTDATWGAFEAGWRGPVGADADHLKTVADIDSTAAAGYSFYTIDPGEWVDGTAQTLSAAGLERAYAALPWDELETDTKGLERRLTVKPVQLDDRTIAIAPPMLARAAVKYGHMVANVSRLYRHLCTRVKDFDLEISVDETETPTGHIDHIYIATELRRLGVEWVSLAPRFVGRFEKGVDYIGDLGELRADLAGHASVARALGPYKLSLHSGSDKFSVYPLIREATRGLVHLKTAGTSYLEALRVAALADPALFREILGAAEGHYTQDRATYHVSADLERVPKPAALADEQLPHLLDDFDARQVLHVTFGSILAEFRPDLMAMLGAHAATYREVLERHFVRHLEPFVRPAGPGEE